MDRESKIIFSSTIAFYKVLQQQIWGAVVDFSVYLVAVNFCL